MTNEKTKEEASEKQENIFRPIEKFDGKQGETFTTSWGRKATREKK